MKKSLILLAVVSTFFCQAQKIVETIDGEFKYPTGVTADSQGNIYIADTQNDKIKIWNIGSKKLQVLEERQEKGCPGSAGLREHGTVHREPGAGNRRPVPASGFVAGNRGRCSRCCTEGRDAEDSQQHHLAALFQEGFRTAAPSRSRNILRTPDASRTESPRLFAIFAAPAP